MKKVFQICILIVVAIMATTACQEDKNIAVTGLKKTSQGDVVEILVGDVYQMTVSVEPANATEQGVVWTSDNSSIATVEGGVIAGILPGAAKIVATTVDGAKSISMEVNVVNPVMGIIFREDLRIARGEKMFTKYGVIPHSAVNKKIRWTSSNTSVATIDENTGEVTGGSTLGTATITAFLRENEEITNSCTVEVALFPATGVSLTQKTLLLDPGRTATLDYNVLPYNADDKGVKWSTSDEEVVTVDELTGLITGVGIGEATITVTTDVGSYEDHCHVTVKKLSYVRVDEGSEDTDWTGRYLVVYEAQAFGGGTGTWGARTVLVFNTGMSMSGINGQGNVIILKPNQAPLFPPTTAGQATDLAAITGGNVDRNVPQNITITGGEIEWHATLEGASITIERVTGGWTIRTASGFYIGNNAGSPGDLGASATSLARHIHTISIGSTTSSVNNNSGDFHNCAIIKSNESGSNNHMRVNANTGRFGYWPSNGQFPIALYRLQ